MCVPSANYGVRSVTLGDLPAQWRQRAEYLQQFGDPNSARLWLLAAVELERALEAFGAETLSLTEAARASGFSAGYLGALVKRGAIANAGRTNAPRIRRADLPVKSSSKPGRPPRRRSDGARADDPGQLTPITKHRR